MLLPCLSRVIGRSKPTFDAAKKFIDRQDQLHHPVSIVYTSRSARKERNSIYIELTKSHYMYKRNQRIVHQARQSWLPDHGFLSIELCSWPLGRKGCGCLMPDGIVASSSATILHPCAVHDSRWGNLTAAGVIIIQSSTVLVHSNGPATSTRSRRTHGCPSTRSSASLVMYPEPLLFLVRFPLLRSHALVTSTGSGTSSDSSRDRRHREWSCRCTSGGCTPSTSVSSG